MFKKYITRVSTLLATTAAMLLSIPASAVDLALSQQPLFLSPTVAPLNMLVVGRDHKLYYEAYNDYTDLDGDGTLDMRFKPGITYYGYFDSTKCYAYGADGVFDPTRTAGTGNTCTAVDSEWSGNFLNYVTTARIDALRKVLYGGFRSTDTATETVLQRTYLPQDAHSWGKEYTSVAVDGYNIADYTSLALPTANNRHLFANTTITSTPDSSNPLMRVLTNRAERIWNWVSIERPVANDRMFNGDNGPLISPAPTDYYVRVRVCKTGLLESNCQAYTGGGNKPIGLLQEFGGNDSMYFGLITGSYSKNTSGGVLRRRMDSIASEINDDGTFKTGNSNAGIIATLNRMRVTGFNSGSHQYNCGWTAAARTINEGECQMWGNPIAEMMYESLRYFAGQSAPTSAYSIAFGAGEESQLAGGGLPVATWNDPYSGTGAHPYCAKPFQTVVSDINPSYDTDQLPGTAFGSFSGTLGTLNVSALGQTIWDNEFGGSQNVFIGQSGNVTDGAPTPKTVTSFGNIRGLSPEEPTKRGGYYAGSVAYYGRTNDISSARGTQNVQTFAVALASPLPKIRIPIGTGANVRTVTLVPFAKSVNGSGISATASFQPTDQIVDFYVDTLSDTYGKFRVNFEDVEQGADHDMDAIAIYEYTVTGNTVNVKVTSEYAYGGITQHMGYVISGTTHDGIYLEVLDQRGGDVSYDTDYFLDTPEAFTGTPPAPNSGVGRWNDGAALPFVHERTFSAGTSPGAILLNDPLWYAAKWGGFTDTNENNLPDLESEWDSDRGSGQAGVPDNYFLVTNALTLSQQLREAFTEILARNASASSASVNSGAISTDSRVYQARFNTRNWDGELMAFGRDPATSLVSTTPLWNARDRMPAPDARKIFTVNSDNTAVPFRWDNLDATRRTQLADTEQLQQTYVNYLRGDQTNEGSGTNYLRERASRLGDIVSSAPLYVGAPRARYADNMPGTTPYSEFAEEQQTRKPLLFAGANDGMLHAFEAGGLVANPSGPPGDMIEDPSGGREVFAYIPKSVFPNLRLLPRQPYSHRYYVDGSPNSNDVFFRNANEWRTVLVGGLNLGGQGIYALDITDTSALTSAEANAGSIHLWEFTDENDRDLGYTYSQPAIVRLKDGSWAAVFGNGYNNTVTDGRASTTGNAVLYIVNIETGALIRKIDTGVGMSDPRAGGKPNGLATPTMVDIDGDRIVDFAYAGDLLGNLWKFNLRPTESSQWGVAFTDTNGNPAPIFAATDSNAAGGNIQPITVRPEVARGPYGAGTIVVFGTGKFLEIGDKDLPAGSTTKQSFYGLVDRDNYTAATNTYDPNDKVVRNRLVQQTITSETNAAPLRRSTSMTAMNRNGWYLDLVYQNNIRGERAVTDPTIRGDRVFFTTLIPNSVPCDFGGRSWLMILDLLSGGRLPDGQVDSDGDGDIDQADADTSGVGTEDIQSRVESQLCLDGSNCEYDSLLSSGSSGALTERAGAPTRGLQGRQSWRQIR
ncbi:pilus assembly protein [Peristeroidobacter soli]|uniref:pilus assembly protein n=1 Tax=Peristeroidobacter soli TaxID=2497877 RepID=UPI0013005015|nr:PilC/PilY family type IV pilus protein [Peristeroidobacter soli]